MRSESNQRKLRYASARDRAEKKQSQGSFSASYLKIPQGVKLFKPKVGVMLLDILPFVTGDGNPCADPGLLHYERTYHLHPRVSADGNPYMCPRLSSKSPCPICEHRTRLLKANDPHNEDLVKDMAPKERQLFNVVNLKEPEKGVQLWDISYHLFGKLLDARIRNADEDDGWDRFAALEGGFTLKVGFKESTFGGRTFLEAETIDFKPRKEDYSEEDLEKVLCLDELLIEPDYDELKEVFLEAGPGAGKKSKPAEEEDEDAVKSKRKPAPVEDEDEDKAPPIRKKPTPVEEDEDEPPVRASKRPPVEEDEEPVPKRRSAPVEDEDEDEAPVKKARRAQADADPDEDEWEDFDKKKGRKAAEADEDEPPAAKRRPAPAEDEDEDETPVKKSKRPAPEDEDEEDVIRRKKPAPEDEDEDDIIRPKKKPAPAEDEDEDEDAGARKPNRFRKQPGDRGFADEGDEDEQPKRKR